MRTESATPVTLKPDRHAANRYGLLALISALFFLHLTIFYPITSEFSAWYASDFVLGLIVALAIAVFGFYTSLAGQPLFRGAIPDD